MFATPGGTGVVGTTEPPTEKPAPTVPINFNRNNAQTPPDLQLEQSEHKSLTLHARVRVRAIHQVNDEEFAVPTDSYVLYYFHDAASQLLYVGITCNPPARFMQHRRDKYWWNAVSDIHIENFDSRAELENAERKAIQSERPKYNINHNGGTRVDEDVQSDCLVGKWFHTTCECPHGAQIADWQGRVRGTPRDMVLVELFDWMWGQCKGQRLITLAEFVSNNPILYDSDEDMRYNHEHGALSHRCELAR